MPSETGSSEMRAKNRFRHFIRLDRGIFDGRGMEMSRSTLRQHVIFLFRKFWYLVIVVKRITLQLKGTVKCNLSFSVGSKYCILNFTWLNLVNAAWIGNNINWNWQLQFSILFLTYDLFLFLDFVHWTWILLRNDVRYISIVLKS